jgi:hypothetical protein
MAKGKGSRGTNYTSKGERPNVKTSTTKAVRDSMSYGEKMLNIQAAWEAGKNPWVRPTPLAPKVRTNELWGNPKENVYKMKMSNG